MSSLEPRGGSRPSRRAREQRAYRLVLVGSTAGLVAVAGAILAIVGVIGWTIPVLAVILAVICTILFRRAVQK
jgi:uncharacterized membrane protein